MGVGENVNPVGVLVNGGGLLSLLASVAVTGGDMSHCWEEVALCDACCCAVCWLSCCVGCCFELGQFVDDAAAVVWAAAAVSADVFGLAAADAIALAAVTVWNAVLADVVECPVAVSLAYGTVTACLTVDPGCGSVVVLVHGAE